MVGAQGVPIFTDPKAFSTALEPLRAGHAVKLEEFYGVLRRVTSAPRLDMFSRRTIEAFDAWGNEASDLPLRAYQPHRVHGHTAIN